MDKVARVKRFWHDLEAWLKQRVPHWLETLPPPVPEDKLESLESQLGFALPEEFKASYRVHDGLGESKLLRLETHQYDQYQVYGILHKTVWEWLPLEAIAPAYTQTLDIYKDIFPEAAFKQVEAVTTLKGPVKSQHWNERWIPFQTLNGADIVTYLDLDPAEGGRVGQVIQQDMEACHQEVVASSLAEWLEAHLLHLKKAYYDASGDVLWVSREAFEKSKI
jgi:cell wall assembly regulator SMI1